MVLEEATTARYLFLPREVAPGVSKIHHWRLTPVYIYTYSTDVSHQHREFPILEAKCRRGQRWPTLTPFCLKSAFDVTSYATTE